MNDDAVSNLALAGVVALVAVGAVGASVAFDSIDLFSAEDACQDRGDCASVEAQSVATPLAEPRVAFEIEETFVSADLDMASREDTFMAEPGFETLEIELAYAGVGDLHVQVFAPDGSLFYECEARVTTVPPDHEMEPTFVEKAEPGEYTVKIGVTGRVDISLVATQHPPGHMPGGMHHARGEA